MRPLYKMLGQIIEFIKDIMFRILIVLPVASNCDETIYIYIYIYTFICCLFVLVAGFCVPLNPCFVKSRVVLEIVHQIIKSPGRIVNKSSETCSAVMETSCKSCPNVVQLCRNNLFVFGNERDPCSEMTCFCFGNVYAYVGKVICFCS